jgi:hypothetical protein
LGKGFAVGLAPANKYSSTHVCLRAMKATHPLLLTSLATLAFLLPPAFAVNKALKPAWMSQVTKSSPGKFQKVPPCELTYNMSWNGLVKAGEAKLTLGLSDPKTPKYLLGTCEGKSAGLAKRLWYYKLNFLSQVDSNSLRPVYYESTETEKKEKIFTKSWFANGKVTSKETTQKRSNGKSKTKERVFAYEHTHDLLSAVLYLRSLPLNNGDKVNMVIHPSNSAYYAQFRVLGRESFKTALGKQKAIKLDIELKKIDRDSLQLKNYTKMKKATIWISEDAYRMPLELRSEVFIGSVRATLAARKRLKS